jgi:hypothetical protein
VSNIDGPGYVGRGPWLHECVKTAKLKKISPEPSIDTIGGEHDGWLRGAPPGFQNDRSPVAAQNRLICENDGNLRFKLESMAEIGHSSAGNNLALQRR